MNNQDNNIQLQRKHSTKSGTGKQDERSFAPRKSISNANKEAQNRNSEGVAESLEVEKSKSTHSKQGQVLHLQNNNYLGNKEQAQQLDKDISTVEVVPKQSLHENKNTSSTHEDQKVTRFKGNSLVQLLLLYSLKSYLRVQRALKGI